VTAWVKQLRRHYAASTVNCIVCVFAMLMDDAVDQHLIPANPVCRRSRRGRRCDQPHPPTERVWTTPEKTLRIAQQAGMLGGRDAELLVITTAWTGCRWGEMAGLQPHNVDLVRKALIIDAKTGALHESSHTIWLGPPKTPSSARIIPLPPFLVELLREHLAQHTGQFVFTSPLGYPLRRSDFDRRVFRPAVDGNRDHPNASIHAEPVQPGLTFHGLRHSHKTWMIADGIPEIAQAKRLGHHLSNRLVETYSHVAPEIETRLLRGLEQRWQHANHARRPADNRPRRSPTTGAHHIASGAAQHPAHKQHTQPAPAHYDEEPSGDKQSGGMRPPEFLHHGAPQRSSPASGRDHCSHKKSPPTRQKPDRKALIKLWS
jgi:integrase